MISGQCSEITTKPQLLQNLHKLNAGYWTRLDSSLLHVLTLYHIHNQILSEIPISLHLGLFNNWLDPLCVMQVLQKMNQLKIHFMLNENQIKHIFPKLMLLNSEERRIQLCEEHPVVTLPLPISLQTERKLIPMTHLASYQPTLWVSPFPMISHSITDIWQF